MTRRREFFQITKYARRHDKQTGKFSYPYNRRIAGQHRHFTMEDYKKWLKKAERDDLALVLRRLAQLNQSKVYLFWKRSLA